MTSTTTWQERQRQIEDERKAALAELAAEVRRQRRADYEAAEERLRQAKVRCEELQSALKANVTALRVAELHRLWLDDVRAFDAREVFRPRPTRYRTDPLVREADYSEAELALMTRQQVAFAERDRQWLARLKAEQCEYRRAVEAAGRLEEEFHSHPFHIEIERLRQQVSEAAQAVNNPIGD